MKSEKERLLELDKELFYFKFFSGTRMPTCPSYIQIVMFNDVFSIETEEGRKEEIDDTKPIRLVKELIWSNIENFEFMEKNPGEVVRTSHNHNLSFKMNCTSISINRNTLNEEAKMLYITFENELLEIIDPDNYI